MSSRELYKRFASLCQKWPKDETKLGRDFGEFFRHKLSEQFPHGELSQVKDPKKVEEALSSLERIANNNYFNENLLKKSSSSGQDVYVCRQAVSNEGLQLVQEQDENSLLSRLKKTLNIKYLASFKEEIEKENSSQTKAA